MPRPIWKPSKSTCRRAVVLSAITLLSGRAAQAGAVPRGPTSAEVLASATASDWRRLDDARTLYLELPAGRVILELAPAFAPEHVENIQTLARERYFDGLAILRAQDNYVVQWGDPAASDRWTFRRHEGAWYYAARE